MRNTAVGEQPASVPAMSRLTRQHLHDTVVEYLRDYIVKGVLAPGVKLNERELCETLGISRTPLREAIKVLAAEGLIEISANRGAAVTKLAESEIDEMFELMSGLEAFTGELACERITPHEIAEIKALHYAMVACREREDLSGYYGYNQQIHDRINEAARNCALRQTYLSINRRLQAMRFKSNFHKSKWDHAVHDHEEMIKALESRDGKRLSAILRQHLLDKRDVVLVTLVTARETPATGGR